MKANNSIKKVLSLILVAALGLMLVACSKNTYGSGSKSFKLEVTGTDGKTSTYTVKTDKATVGEALLDEKLIAGEDSQYGLYVTSVTGIKAVWEETGTYWAFYINGEYAMTGVDSTNVEDGATYAFKIE